MDYVLVAAERGPALLKISVKRISELTRYFGPATLSGCNIRIVMSVLRMTSKASILQTDQLTSSEHVFRS